MSRAAVLSRATVLCAVAVLAAVVMTGSTEPAPSYYLSLGDSLARGWQPGADGQSHETSEGYVDRVGDALRARHPGLHVVKLGCPGETTASMVSGGTCRYDRGGELAQAESFLRAHRGSVVAVSVNIGDNDVEQCLQDGVVDEGCVRSEMSGVRTRLPAIASRLRAAAGPGVRIVGLTDYDQFLAYSLRGPSGQRFAQRSVAVVTALNRTVDAIYARAGIRVADATGAFATTDPQRGVRRICAWTWACSAVGGTFNDHANARGYRVLASVVLHALA